MLIKLIGLIKLDSVGFSFLIELNQPLNSIQLNQLLLYFLFQQAYFVRVVHL
jgi:hypothetical protein